MTIRSAIFSFFSMVMPPFSCLFDCGFWYNAFISLLKEVILLATNPPKGAGRRGAVKSRRQSYNSKIKRWVKFDSKSGKILDVKSNPKPFKGVSKK